MGYSEWGVDIVILRSNADLGSIILMECQQTSEIGGCQNAVVHVHNEPNWVLCEKGEGACSTQFALRTQITDFNVMRHLPVRAAQERSGASNPGNILSVLKVTQP